MGRIELYYEILKRVKVNGETITHVAEKLGFCRQSLKRAVLEEWTGPKARLLVEKICQYVELEPPPPTPKKKKVTIK